MSAEDSIGGVVFDLDGTLIDSAQDIALAMNHALAIEGMRQRTEDEIRGFIGDGSRKLVERAASVAPEDPVVEGLHRRFVQYYAEHPAEKTVPLDGAMDVLQQLSGRFPLALCTNKPRGLTDRVLSALHMDHFFQAVVGAGDVAHTKPHPDPLLRVSELLQLPCRQLVMIGDGPQDIGCALAAGCRSIALSDGLFASRQSLIEAGAQTVICLREVPALLEVWRPSSVPGNAVRPRM